MKAVLFSAAILLMVAVHASAETAVPDQTVFGAQDSRGAYQEVHIRPFHLTKDYFPTSVRDLLTADAADQAEYSIYAKKDFNVQNWGRTVQIVFQNGELRSENPNSTAYKPVSTGASQVRLYASLAFDSAEQAASGNYEVGGVVTLVGGNSYLGPMGGIVPGPTVGVEQIIELGYQSSTAYFHDGKIGGEFNSFGNGKNDGGRIFMVGITSYTEDVSIGLLKRMMGSIVDVVYP